MLKESDSVIRLLNPIPIASEDSLVNNVLSVVVQEIITLRIKNPSILFLRDSIIFKIKLKKNHGINIPHGFLLYKLNNY
jgi:hypothetical protein